MLAHLAAWRQVSAQQASGEAPGVVEYYASREPAADTEGELPANRWACSYLSDELRVCTCEGERRQPCHR